MLPESKQTRLAAALQALVDVQREYSAAAWPGQVVYILEILQTCAEPGYEDALQALRASITQRLESGRW